MRPGLNHGDHVAALIEDDASIAHAQSEGILSAFALPDVIRLALRIRRVLIDLRSIEMAVLIGIRVSVRTAA